MPETIFKSTSVNSFVFFPKVSPKTVEATILKNPFKPISIIENFDSFTVSESIDKITFEGWIFWL